MKRLVVVVLVILLVGSLMFGAWQYAQNQSLTRDEDLLKRKLDQQAQQLQTLEDEKQSLQVKNAQFEERIQNQTKEIEKLREELKVENYITIGLTFLWNPVLTINRTSIETAIDDLNDEWDPVRVYYFLDHANAESFVPASADLCNLEQWIDRARALYPEPDIPVAIIANTTSNWGGCALVGESGIALRYSVESSAFGPVYGVTEVWYDPAVLTHELLHNFSFDENLLQHKPVTSIPPTWYERIQAAARAFEMPIPLGYFDSS